MHLSFRIFCISSLFFMMACAIGQKNFAKDEQGYIEDTVFHQLIKKRHYDAVGTFDNYNHAHVMKKNRWGIIDLSGKEIIPVKYNSIESFRYNDNNNIHFKLILDGKTYLADVNGKKLFAKGYDEIIILQHSPLILKVKTARGYTIINSKGEKMLYASYDDVALIKHSFSEFKVRKKDYWGVVSRTGKVMIPAIYQEVYAYENGYAAVSRFLEDGIVHMHDTSFWPVSFETIRFTGKGNTAIIRQDHRYGLINMQGRWLLKPEFTNIELKDFKTGKVLFVTKDSANIGFMGITDIQGKTLLPMDRQYIEAFEDDVDLIMISLPYNSQNLSLHGIASTTGEIVCPVMYYSIQNFNDIEIAVITSVNGKLGLIDRTGKVILQPTYDGISDLYFDHRDKECRQDLIKIELNHKYGLINRLGQEVYPPVLDRLDAYDRGLFYAERHDTAMVLDKKGKSILSQKFSAIDFLSEDLDLLQATLGNKEGVFKTNGNLVIPFIYEQLHFSENIFLASKNKKWGMLNLKGSKLTPLHYDSIYKTYYNNNYQVTMNGKKGVLNTDGKIKLPIQYDELVFLPWNLIVARKDSNFHLFKKFKPVAFDTADKILMQTISNILPAEQQNYWNSYPVLYVIFKDKGKLGLLDSTFKVILNPEYDEIHRAGSMVRKDKKTGLINADGTIKVPPAYDRIEITYQGFYDIEGPEGHGLLRPDGSVWISPVYEEVYLESGQNSYCWVKDKGMWGLADSLGHKKTPIQYRNKGSMDKSHPGIFIIREYSARNYINLEGKELLYADDNSQTALKGQFIIKKLSYYWGVVDLHDSIILPDVYKKITFNGSLIIACKEELVKGKRGMIQQDRYYIFNMYNKLSMLKYNNKPQFDRDGFATMKIEKETYLLDLYGNVYSLPPEK